MLNNSEERTQNNNNSAQSTPMNGCGSVFSKSPEMGISEIQDNLVIVAAQIPIASSSIGTSCEIRMLPSPASKAATTANRMPSTSSAEHPQREGHHQSNAVASVLVDVDPVPQRTAPDQMVSVLEPNTTHTYTTVSDQCDWLHTGGDSSPITIDSSLGSYHSHPDTYLELFHDLQIGPEHGVQDCRSSRIGSGSVKSTIDSKQTKGGSDVSTPPSNKTARHFDFTPTKVKEAKGSNSQVNSPAEMYLRIPPVGSTIGDASSDIGSPPRTPTGKLFPSSPEGVDGQASPTAYAYVCADLLPLPTTAQHVQPHDDIASQSVGAGVATAASAGSSTVQAQSAATDDEWWPSTSSVPIARTSSYSRKDGHRHGYGQRHHGQGFSRGSHPYRAPSPPSRLPTPQHFDIDALGNIHQEMVDSGINWRASSARNGVTTSILASMLKSHIPQDQDLPFNEYQLVLQWALFRMDPQIFELYGRSIWDKEFSKAHESSSLKQGGTSVESTDTPPPTPTQAPPSVKLLRLAQRDTSNFSNDSSVVDSSMASRERAQKEQLASSCRPDEGKALRVAASSRQLRQRVFNAHQKPPLSFEAKGEEGEEDEDLPPPLTYESDEDEPPSLYRKDVQNKKTVGFVNKQPDMLSASPTSDNGQGLEDFRATSSYKKTPARVMTADILNSFQSSHIQAMASVPVERPSAVRARRLFQNLLERESIHFNAQMSHSLEVTGSVPPEGPVNSTIMTRRRSQLIGGTHDSSSGEVKGGTSVSSFEIEEARGAALESGPQPIISSAADPVSPASTKSNVSSHSSARLGHSSSVSSTAQSNASTLPALSLPLHSGPPGRHSNGLQLMQRFIYKASPQVQNLLLSLIVRELRKRDGLQHVGPGKFSFEPFQDFAANSLREVVFDVLGELHAAYKVPDYMREDHINEIISRTDEEWKDDIDTIMKWQKGLHPNYSRELSATSELISQKGPKCLPYCLPGEGSELFESDSRFNHTRGNKGLEDVVNCWGNATLASLIAPEFLVDGVYVPKLVNRGKIAGSDSLVIADQVPDHFKTKASQLFFLHWCLNILKHCTIRTAQPGDAELKDRVTQYIDDDIDSDKVVAEDVEEDLCDFYLGRKNYELGVRRMSNNNKSSNESLLNKCHALEAQLKEARGLLEQRAILASLDRSPRRRSSQSNSFSSSSSSSSAAAASELYSGANTIHGGYGPTGTLTNVSAACAEACFWPSEDYFDAALLDLFDDYGKSFGVNPFFCQPTSNKQQINNCDSCTSTYITLSEHLNLVSCRCGANVLPCRPHTLDDCRVHSAACHLHAQMRSKPLELLQLFNEVSNSPGAYFCILCGKSTTSDWKNRHSHHVWNNSTRQFIPICTSQSMHESKYRNNNIVSIDTGIGQQSNSDLSARYAYVDPHLNSLNKVNSYVTSNTNTNNGTNNKPSILLRENYITNNDSTHISQSNGKNESRGDLFISAKQRISTPEEIENGLSNKTETFSDFPTDNHNCVSRTFSTYNENSKKREFTPYGFSHPVSEKDQKVILTNPINNGPSGLFVPPVYKDEKEKENIPPLPRGFIRASDLPHSENTDVSFRNNTDERGSRFTTNSNDLQHAQRNFDPTLYRKGHSDPFPEKEEISDHVYPAHLSHGTDSHQLRATRKPLRDLSPLHEDLKPTVTRQNIFGIANDDIEVHNRDSNLSYPKQPSIPKSGIQDDYSSINMPLVPYRTYRQETHDEDDRYDMNYKHRHQSQTYQRDDEDDLPDRHSKPKKRNGRHRSDGSDSEDSSTIQSKSSYTSRGIPTLFALLQVMECPPNYLEALSNLKSMLKKSDLTEVLPPRYESERGRRRQVRYSEYFPERYTGKAVKLKRYLQRLLQYSAQVANDDQTRADIMADGVGLSETCLTQLDYAAKVPLPGFAEIDDDSVISQKKRTLDILLTYVFLFYQEEPNAAVNDLRLEGNMLTGLLDLYHNLHKGSVTLPAKFIEDYLTRGILRASNGQGIS